VRDGAKHVASGLARLHQDIDPLPGRHQYGVRIVGGLIRLAWNARADPRQRDAVTAFIEGVAGALGGCQGRV
jgi:hypothetical protein